MLSAVDVDCGYGSVPVLQGASISIGRGRIVGLRGPSGTGKTTIARTLTGLLPPLRGAVTLDGEPLDFVNPLVRDAAGRATHGTRWRASSGSLSISDADQVDQRPVRVGPPEGKTSPRQWCTPQPRWGSRRTCCSGFPPR